jgi:DNA-binding NarL/FixJ family response regulator
MRVLIVDDHALVRAGIVRLLQGQAASMRSPKHRTRARRWNRP